MTARGQVVVRPSRRGDVYALRFRAYGRRRYVTLGREEDGWDRRAAEEELARVLAAVRLGQWRDPREPRAGSVREVPTLAEFAADWYARRLVEGGRDGRGLSSRSAAGLRWQIDAHLLPALGQRRLDAISVEDVDDLRVSLLAGGLAPATVRKLINTLDAILTLAAEYGHVPRSVAAGRARRPRVPRRRGSYLARADHIAALLDAAGRLDGIRGGAFRPLLAVLVFAGLRIEEALTLRWADVDLAAGVLRVRGTKSRAAERTVRLLPVLRDSLAEHRAARAHEPPSAYVFRTATGGKPDASNVRKRDLRRAVTLAAAALAEAGVPALPARITPHTLRRTYASLMFAVGETPPAVMRALGHADARMTLEVYAAEMERADGEPERLRALVDGPGLQASPETARTVSAST